MQSPILRPFPAKFSPAACSPVRRLLPLPPIRRPDHPSLPLVASASGDIDAFTKYSGYLFEAGDSSEAEFPRDYDLRAIAAIYRRKPFLVLRRSLQIGSLLGRWLAVRYFDSVQERSDEMFKTRAMELRMILLELGPAFVKIAQAVSSRPMATEPTSSMFSHLFPIHAHKTMVHGGGARAEDHEVVCAGHRCLQVPTSELRLRTTMMGRNQDAVFTTFAFS